MVGKDGMFGEIGVKGRGGSGGIGGGGTYRLEWDLEGWKGARGGGFFLGWGSPFFFFYCFLCFESGIVELGP